MPCCRVYWWRYVLWLCGTGPPLEATSPDFQDWLGISRNVVIAYGVLPYCECLGRDGVDLVEEGGGGGGKGKDRPPLFLVDSSGSSQHCEHDPRHLLKSMHFKNNNSHFVLTCSWCHGEKMVLLMLSCEQSGIQPLDRHYKKGLSDSLSGTAPMGLFCNVTRPLGPPSVFAYSTADD